MEIVIIVLLVGCIVWLVMKQRKRIDESEEATLANAWRTVLSDPNYKERRPLEERKHAAEGEARKFSEAAREASHPK